MTNDDFHARRTELANACASAAAEWLDFMGSAGALAAIPNTAQYVVDGDPAAIRAQLDTVAPQRRMRHGDRPELPLYFGPEAGQPRRWAALITSAGHGVLQEYGSKFQHAQPGQEVLEVAEILSGSPAIANKAEAEPIRQALELMVDRFGPCESEYIFSKRLAIQKARAALLAAPPATTGAMPKDLAIQCLNALSLAKELLDCSPGINEAYEALSKFIIDGEATGASTGWQKLNDVQWMNIVNHDHAYESYSKDDAVHEAVKRTEAKLKELNSGSVGTSTVLTDERLRETDGYKLGWMEGMQEGAELATGVGKTAADVEAEFADLLPGSYYMDPPDGGSPSVLEQVSRMAEDAAKWREVAAQAGRVAVPIYQVQQMTEQGSSAWHDASEDAYQTFMPERRRIVHAAPSPAKESK